MSRYRNQVSVIASCTKRIQGFEEYVESDVELPIDGVVHTASEVVAIFQACIDKRQALAAVRAEEKAALAEVAAADAERVKAERALAPWVKARFGVDSKPAIAFGFEEKTRAVRSAADKARSAQLARATREARGTMSKKEKAKIKGVLPEVPSVSDPPASPAPLHVTNGVAPHATNGVVAHVTNGVARAQS